MGKAKTFRIVFVWCATRRIRNKRSSPMSHSQNFLPNLFVARANRGSPLKWRYTRAACARPWKNPPSQHPIVYAKFISALPRTMTAVERRCRGVSCRIGFANKQTTRGLTSAWHYLLPLSVIIRTVAVQWSPATSHTSRFVLRAVSHLTARG